MFPHATIHVPHPTQTQGKFGLTGRHCSIAGKFKFPQVVAGLDTERYAFGYWLEITDSVSPAPGETIAQTSDGSFYAAFHVANGPNIMWTAAVVNTRAIKQNTWHYISGSFLSGRRGLTPQVTACTDHVCTTNDLRFHSNDIIGYEFQSQLHVGAVFGKTNIDTELLAPVVGKVDEVLIKSSYDTPEEIVARYETRYTEYSPTDAVFMTVATETYYSPTAAVTLRAALSPFDKPNDEFEWVFASPANFVLTQDMSTTPLNSRTLSLKANILQAGTVYVFKVCTLGADAVCSGATTFTVVSAPSVASVTARCEAATCGTDGVHFAQLSEFEVETVATPGAVPGVSGAILQADLEYYYETEDPVTLDPIPLTAGFAANQALMNRVLLPAGSSPDYELTLRVEVRQITTGFVSTGSVIVKVRPNEDSQLNADLNVLSAVQTDTSPSAKIAAITASADASVGGQTGSRYARSLVAASVGTPYLLTLFTQINSELLTGTGNAMGTIHPSILMTLQNLLDKLNDEVVAVDSPTVEYLTNVTALITDSAALLSSVLSTQVDVSNLDFRLERVVIRCVDLIQSLVSRMAALSVHVFDFDPITYHTKLDAVRTLYLKKAMDFRAPYTPQYSFAGILQDSASYAGLTPLDKDNGYPQRTVLNVTTSFQGAGTRVGVSAESYVTTNLVTPGSGYVTVKTPAHRFSSGTQEVVATVVLTPNSYVSRAEGETLAATDAALVHIYEKNGANLVDISQRTGGTPTTSFRILCPSCTQEKASFFHCAYIKASDLTVSTAKWERVGSTVSDGVIECNGGEPYGSYYAGFRDATALASTPSPWSTAAPLESVHTFEMHIAKLFSVFTTQWFVTALVTALSPYLLRGDVEVLMYCNSNGGARIESSCRDGSAGRGAVALAEAGEGTFVRFQLSLLQDVDVIVALLKNYATNCSAANPLGAAGLCPLPGTSLFEGVQTPVPTETPPSPGDNEWVIIGVLLAAGAVALLVFVMLMCYCNSRGKCCFSGYAHGSDASSELSPPGTPVVAEMEPVAPSPGGVDTTRV